MRKTVVGWQIKTLSDFVIHFDALHWFYYCGKVVHPGVLGSFQFNFLRHEIARGVVVIALNATDHAADRRPYVSHTR